MASKQLVLKTPFRVLAAAMVMGALLGAGLVPAVPFGADDTALVAVPAQVAFAGEDMCDGDPIFMIGKERLNIVVRIPVSAAKKFVSATKPVVVTVHAPAGVTSKQIGYTGGFAEQGLIKFNNSSNAAMAGKTSYNITVQVQAPDPLGKGTYPVYVTATSSTQTVSWSGASGKTLTGNVNVPR